MRDEAARTPAQTCREAGVLRAAGLRLLVALPLLPLFSCAHSPERPPQMLESKPALNGYFIGRAVTTERYSTKNARRLKCDVTVNLVEGTYTITGDGKAIASSSGRYYLGPQIVLEHTTSPVTAAAGERALQGAFDFSWSGRLLVLEQWDALKDRLILVILERTAPPVFLFPYPAPDAQTPPTAWPPRRHVSRRGVR